MAGGSWFARHEALAKKRSLQVYQLYLKARDRERAARLIDDFTQGKLSYKELIKKLERLARG